MIDAQTYLEHIRRDGERIAAAAGGNLSKPVPSCPGNTVESLLMHAAGVLIWWTAALQQNAEPEPDWTKLSGEMIEAFRRALPEVLDELSSRDPDQPTWTWGNDQHVRFAYRRIAQELSIHRWDFENAVGDPGPIDPTLAADGVDEMLEEFTVPPPPGLNVENVVSRFDGTGQRLRFEATDVPRTWTITTNPDRFDVSGDGEGDVTANSAASDINLFLWGRVPPSALEVAGDATLLGRWQDRVKI